MKITVLNGSPKGNLSGTLQYVNFMQKKFPGHELRVHHISQRINKIEKDASAFQEIMQDIKTSDGVLWALPVYIFLVPSQYKRFIELLSERKVKNVFRNKYTAVITTSIHFFDHTANEYMHAICDDLSMKYAGFFSADMHDLLKEEERKKLLLFAESFFEAIVDKAPAAPYFKPLSNRNFDYVPGPPESKVNQGDNRILLLTDSGDSQTNLGKMIRRFKESFTADIRVIDLNDIDIKGGCLGCIVCGNNYGQISVFKMEAIF
jgi:multimeric flavodoxin WrbA